MATDKLDISTLLGTSSNFSEDIENLVWELDVTYMEAVLIWCERKNIEVDQIVGFIKRDSNLKANIQMEGERINMLEKTARLPF